MATLASEQRVWRELCSFHFNKRQMKYILDKNKLNHQSEIKDWKKFYHDLRRAFGVSEDYQFAEVLSLSNHPIMICISCCRMPSSSEEDNSENENSLATSVTSSSSCATSTTPPPPHCHITIRCTREIAGFNGLGEAVQRLDFRSSVHDRRRFHYICALLRLLVAGKGIANLPGSAQKLLLRMIEEVAAHVNDNQQNINVLRGLVLQLQDIVNQENQKCWGKPLGSPNLWNENVRTIKRIQSITSQIKIKEPGPEIRPKIHDLPEECVREIILRIADHRDLEV
uniref:F-box domain-containing protein n=1 Tax=Megaselia scalaris TaxID=36166 RepID=T1GI63_MEGSC